MGDDVALLKQSAAALQRAVVFVGLYSHGAALSADLGAVLARVNARLGRSKGGESNGE